MMDLESRLHAENPAELRLWLRLLTCTQLVEKKVRSGLRTEFETTLPRFDMMAQLERSPHGLKMGELSKRMMVSSGNITAITDQLVKEGWVERVDQEDDRRAWRVKLTDEGRGYFNQMAHAHEGWIKNAFDALSPKESQLMYELLHKIKLNALGHLHTPKTN